MLIKNLFRFNNIFLYILCNHIVISLRDFPANITLPTILVLNSIVTPSSHRVSPQGSFSPITSQHHARQSCHTSTNKSFSIYGVRIPPQHSKPTCIQGSFITKLIPRNQGRVDLQFYNFYIIYNKIRHTYDFRKILAHILLLSPFFVGREGRWLRLIIQVTYTEFSHN